MTQSSLSASSGQSLRNRFHSFLTRGKSSFKSQERKMIFYLAVECYTFLHGHNWIFRKIIFPWSFLAGTGTNGRDRLSHIWIMAVKVWRQNFREERDFILKPTCRRLFQELAPRSLSCVCHRFNCSIYVGRQCRCFPYSLLNIKFTEIHQLNDPRSHFFNYSGFSRETVWILQRLTRIKAVKYENVFCSLSSLSPLPFTEQRTRPREKKCIFSCRGKRRALPRKLPEKSAKIIGCRINKFQFPAVRVNNIWYCDRKQNKPTNFSAAEANTDFYISNRQLCLFPV